VEHCSPARAVPCPPVSTTGSEVGVEPAPGLGEVVRSRSVATLLLLGFAAHTASFLQAAVLGKQLYDITGSTLALGLLGLVEFLPALLLMPVTGGAADRFDRRHVGAAGIYAETLTALFLAFYASTDPTSAIPLFLVAAVFGTARAFVAPCTRSLAPLVAPPRGLQRVVAVNSVVWQTGLIIGPAASGFLYDRSAALPYLVAAACFAIGATLLATIPLRTPQSRLVAMERATVRRAIEGLRFVRSQPILLGAIALDLFAVLFGGAVALLPAIAEERLGVGNVGYGWLRAAPGVGAIVLAGILAFRPTRRRVGRTLLLAVAVFGAATVVLGLTRSFVVAFGALVVLSGADAVSMFIRQTIVPLATPDSMRGRVTAVENVFIGASNELGAFESGVVSTAIGIAPTVALGGAVTMLVVAVWWWAFPRLRRLDRFDDLEHAR